MGQTESVSLSFFVLTSRAEQSISKSKSKRPARAGTGAGRWRRCPGGGSICLSAAFFAWFALPQGGGGQN